MKDKRVQRINHEMMRVLSQIVADLKDPGVSSMTSISEVRVTRDLSRAEIFVSVLGSESEKQKTLNALNRAKGFIKKELGMRMELRLMPELLFLQDNSIEHGVYMAQLIEQVKTEDENKRKESQCSELESN